jgi:hypothetical protein
MVRRGRRFESVRGLLRKTCKCRARIVRRAEIGSEEIVTRLVAEARRVFADAGAVQR